MKISRELCVSIAIGVMLTLAWYGITGCGSTAARPTAHHPAASATVTCSLLTCSHGKVGQACSVGNYPGITVQSAPNQLACDPAPSTDMTITPPPSATAPAAVTPPPPAPVSTAATLTGTCTPGYFLTGQGAVFEPG